MSINQLLYLTFHHEAIFNGMADELMIRKISGTLGPSYFLSTSWLWQSYETLFHHLLKYLLHHIFWEGLFAYSIF